MHKKPRTDVRQFLQAGQTKGLCRGMKEDSAVMNGEDFAIPGDEGGAVGGQLHGDFDRVWGGNGKFRDHAVLPDAGERVPAPCAESREAAVCQLRGDRRKEGEQSPLVALQNHFANSRRAAEVAVNLERWMGVK